MRRVSWPYHTDILYRLQKLQESTAFHQMSGEEWSGCCRLFQFDVEKKGYADSVPLAGLNRPLFQHQAFGVYWQMKQGRSTFGGGFVADDPGLGKSLTYLAYIVAERQLNWLCDDIEKSRATKDSKHLGAHASGLCPTNSERENWIACPCSKDSVTYGWIKKEGLRLVCVAAPLVPYWRSQWRAHVDTTEPRLRMQLLIAHKGTTKDKEAKGDEDALLPPNVNQLKSVQQEQRAENKSRANQDRFLVVTSPATFFDSWLPKFMYTGDVLVAGATGRGKWEKSQKKLGIVFGIAMVDEFHEEYRISAPRSKVLATLPGRPFCWGYSGTPYGQSPRCLEGILWAIENNASRSPPYGTETGWEQSPAMMPYAHRQLDVVCKQYESYVKAVDKDPRELDEIIKRFIPFVKTFILRRTGETKVSLPLTSSEHQLTSSSGTIAASCNSSLIITPTSSSKTRTATPPACSKSPNALLNLKPPCSLPSKKKHALKADLFPPSSTKPQNGHNSPVSVSSGHSLTSLLCSLLHFH